jgi:hypothetical protein
MLDSSQRDIDKTVIQLAAPATNTFDPNTRTMVRICRRSAECSRAATPKSVFIEILANVTTQCGRRDFGNTDFRACLQVIYISFRLLEDRL